MKRTYGWKRDIPDPRDRLHTAAVMSDANLPEQFSMVDKMPACYDQKSLGSCSGQAVIGLAHYRELTDGNKARTIRPSILFEYYNTRLIEGSVAFDSGATIRNAVKALVRYGMCRDQLWPYVISKFDKKPPAAAYSEATKYRSLSYFRVPQTLNSLKSQLFSNNPIVFGMAVFESFESNEVARTGIVPVPDLDKESRLGGHAMLLVGWNDAVSRFIVRNSWGTQWGKNGYCEIPYSLLLERNMSADLWTFSEIK